MTPGTPTRLGSKIAGGVSQSAPASPVSAPIKHVLAAGRRGEEVTIPVLGRMWIELPGARQWQEIEAAIRREMRRLEIGDLTSGDITVAAAHQAELAMRVLAVAARDPDDHAKPFGTLEEWGELDNDLISIAWHAWGDVRDRLDPVSMPLTDEDMIAIGVAVKKKDGPSLRTYGVAKLSRWLVTTADLQSTSQAPSSPSLDLPSEHSESPTPS